MIHRKNAYRFIRLFMAFNLLMSSTLHAQKQFNVLDWKSDVSLNTYLVQQMKQQYEMRSKELQRAVGSKQATLDYINSARNKYLQLLGQLPKRSKLNASISGVIDQPNYSIQKVVYESFPGHHVTANLYLPTGKGPFPAALLFCGHEDIAKATESYQKTAILFALNGFVVLVIDPISQSERYQLVDKTGKPMTRGGTTEHTLLNQASNLFGLSTPADELWDNVRGLDYLATRKEVDTSRIGCLGNSGGGMQAIYFAGYDTRVKVVAAASFLMSRERTLELTGASDGCSHIPNEGGSGLEMSDFLIAAAPRPILVLSGRYDFIDYNGTISAFRELEKVYASIGQPDKAKLFTYDDGHGISQPKREAAVTWFRKWFYNDTTEVHEGVYNLLSDKELMATSTGQVVMEFPKEVTIAERNIRLFKTTLAARKKFNKKDRRQVTAQLRKLLSVEEHQQPVDALDNGNVISNNITFHKFILRKENEIPLPALLVYPNAIPKKVIIWLPESGKNKMADSSEFIRSYQQQQNAVVLADLRGMGETEDRAELNDPKYYNREYRNAMLALHIGKPLVGQRVTDIKTIIQFIGSIPELKGLPIEINASGAAALPAIHAAVLEENFIALNLYAAPGSFESIIKDPTAKNWYSYVIPDVLNYYDLPDLIRLVGTKKVSFIEFAFETRTW